MEVGSNKGMHPKDAQRLIGSEDAQTSIDSEDAQMIFDTLQYDPPENITPTQKRPHEKNAPQGTPKKPRVTTCADEIQAKELFHAAHALINSTDSNSENLIKELNKQAVIYLAKYPSNCAEYFTVIKQGVTEGNGKQTTALDKYIEHESDALIFIATTLFDKLPFKLKKDDEKVLQTIDKLMSTYMGEIKYSDYMALQADTICSWLKDTVKKNACHEKHHVYFESYPEGLFFIVDKLLEAQQYSSAGVILKAIYTNHIKKWLNSLSQKQDNYYWLLSLAIFKAREGFIHEEKYIDAFDLIVYLKDKLDKGSKAYISCLQKLLKITQYDIIYKQQIDNSSETLYNYFIELLSYYEYFYNSSIKTKNLPAALQDRQPTNTPKEPKKQTQDQSLALHNGSTSKESNGIQNQINEFLQEYHGDTLEHEEFLTEKLIFILKRICENAPHSYPTPNIDKVTAWGILFNTKNFERREVIDILNNRNIVYSLYHTARELKSKLDEIEKFQDIETEEAEDSYYHVIKATLELCKAILKAQNLLKVTYNNPIENFYIYNIIKDTFKSDKTCIQISNPNDVLLFLSTLLYSSIEKINVFEAGEEVKIKKITNFIDALMPLLFYTPPTASKRKEVLKEQLTEYLANNICTLKSWLTGVVIKNKSLLDSTKQHKCYEIYFSNYSLLAEISYLLREKKYIDAANEITGILTEKTRHIQENQNSSHAPNVTQPGSQTGLTTTYKDSGVLQPQNPTATRHDHLNAHTSTSVAQGGYLFNRLTGSSPVIREEIDLTVPVIDERRNRYNYTCY